MTYKENHELRELYKGTDIIGKVKIRILACLRHVQIREVDRKVKIVWMRQPVGIGVLGRPQLK